MKPLLVGKVAEMAAMIVVCCLSSQKNNTIHFSKKSEKIQLFPI